MKKLPIFLSTAMMTVAGVGVLAPKVLANQVEMAPKGQDLLNLALSEDLLDSNLMEIRGGIDKIYLDSNHMVDEIYPTLINQRDNSLYFQDMMAGDWRPQWLTVVWMDYENGITEEMADTKLETLGTVDASDWAVIYSDGQITQTSLSGFVEKIGDVELLDNKSDLLYYAVRWARVVEQDDGTVVLEDDYWTRGKIDYRKCVHSDNYDIATTRCRQVRADVNKTYNFEIQQNKSPFAVIAYPNGEEVITWEEEWKDILRERSKSYSDKMAVLVEFLSNPEEFLDNAEDVIGKMLRVLPGLSDMNDVLSETKRTQINVELARQLYGELNGDDYGELQEVIKRLESENVVLGKEKEELTSIVAGLEGEILNLSNVKTDLNNKLADTRTELSEAKETISQLEQLRNQLEEKIKVLESGTDEDGTVELLGEINRLKDRILELESGNEELKTMITEGTRQREILENENQQLKLEIEKLKDSASDKCSEVNNDGVESGTNQGGLTEMRYGNGGLNGSGVETERNETVGLEKSEDLEGAGLGADDSEKINNEELEVPILGGGVNERDGRWNWWWMLIPIVAAMGSFIFWVKRAWSKNR